MENKESGYYPTGAEFDPKAPYNDTSKQKEIEVNVSITMSKTFKIQLHNEEDIQIFKDYSSELESEVRSQHTLPDEILENLSTDNDDVTGWSTDEVEFTIE